MSAWNVWLAAPEWILAATALVVLWIDARTRPDDKAGAARAARFGVVIATLYACFQLMGIEAGEPKLAFRGHYKLDHFSGLFKVLFGVTAYFVLGMADTWLKRVDRGHGEFHLLSLFATLGMFFLASGEDFASLFVALELITISFYCLTAFKRNDAASIEAAVKYIVLGAMATAFLLFGIAFLYGATGSLALRDLMSLEIAQQIGHADGALVQFGLLLVLVGLGFKIAAVPFQVWTPDVYQGASSPVTAFLSMGSKAAGFVLLLKVVRAALGPNADVGLASASAWVTLVGVIAIATMLYGNLGALWQGNIKRLMGYSSIGHAGYALMGIAAFDEAGFTAVVYYLIAYLFTVLGIFAVIVVMNGVLKSHAIDSYAGLGRRSPFLALVMTICLLSLAGVPPMGGFFGKFLVFGAIIGKGTTLAYVLAFVGAAGVVISMYYYLMVVKRLYMDEAPEGQSTAPIEITRWMKGILYACLAGILLTGILQSPFVDLASRAAKALVAAG